MELAQEQLAAENFKKGIPAATYVTKNNNKTYRQVLFN